MNDQASFLYQVFLHLFLDKVCYHDFEKKGCRKMNIFVVGANGQIGQHVIEKLVGEGNSVFAGVRDVATQSRVKSENVSYVSFDLTNTVEELATTFKKAQTDILIFAAGSQGKSLLQVDLDGAIKTMIAAEQANVARYFMVSAVFADTREKWPASMTDYYISKHYADEWLMNRTPLDYVIVQPVTLTNDAATKVKLVKPSEEFTPKVSREMIADVLVSLIEHPEITKTTLVVSDGEDTVEDALADWKN